MSRVVDIAGALGACRTSEGGFAIVPGAGAEPEPTALAAIALDDPDARRWLEASQDERGAIALHAGSVARDLSALASLALGPGTARERALDHVEASQAARIPSSPDVPHDAATRGWAWTDDAFGWIEPTSWAVLALRKRRPSSPVIDDGLAVLVDRECEGGGWNYGNREAFGVQLPPFAQTTALSLMALQATQGELVERGLAALRRLLGHEAVGPLTAATAAVALRLLGEADGERLGEEARSRLEGAGASDAVTLAWVTLALAPDHTLGAFTP